MTAGGGLVTSAARHAEQLRANGARVTLVSPDRDSRAAIGRNMLDPSRRAGSARAGRAQAARIVETIGVVWS
ncbi:hypothetical protein ACFQY4_33025 [Catellatospora bangladeshensis]|uniref:hypothetical protein n=1 Tax=Catellatospora bangladeshensis TaxID=310355 RepID=UPI00360D0C93